MIASLDSRTKTDRYILTRVGQLDLAFQAQWIDEFIVVNRVQILRLSFYSPAVLGIAHCKGRMLPLISAQYCLVGGEVRDLPSDRVIAVCLSEAAPTAGGVGLVVDRILGSQRILEPTSRLFKSADIPNQIWQPLRWQKLSA
ncbi:MAG: chemotaxis protein CheW [Cyanobacteria bacterium J06641_5]